MSMKTNKLHWWLRLSIAIFIAGVMLALCEAWLLALFAPIDSMVAKSVDRQSASTSLLAWRTIVESRKTAKVVTSYVVHAGQFRQEPLGARVPAWSEASAVPNGRMRNVGTIIVERAYGWPFDACYWREEFSQSNRTRSLSIDVQVVSRSPLPLGIVVPGLLGNAMCFTACVGVVVVTWISLRSTNRRRRGICVVCKYPCRGFERCSECGTIQ